MRSLSASEIKAIRALSQKKVRDREGLFIAEGEKIVAEALSNGADIVGIYRRDEIGDELMSRISLQDSPSPVLAVIRKPGQKAPVPSEGLFLALDSIRDPGNLGTIMRICDWWGIDGIFASLDTVDQYNPKVVQASMGAIFRKHITYCHLPQLCADFRSQGYGVFGTFLDGNDLYSEELAPKGLIVMGSESFGISPEIGALCDRRLKIPSFGSGPKAESLNVAIATAVTVAEFRRKFL